MDSILSYHMNPLTCGVARFNHAIGMRLNLRVLPIFSDVGRSVRSPLISFKASELRRSELEKLSAIERSGAWPDLRLFLHDYSSTVIEKRLIDRAVRVYCGNAALKRRLESLNGNVVEAWCPGVLFEKRVFDTDAEIRIFTFGMAHKLRVDFFHDLHQLLRHTGRTYVVYISAAIHEGTSLDEFTVAYEELQKIFHERVFFLGLVSDGALHAFLKSCTFFAAFFQDGVRANNSSVNTAMQCGAVVLTNLDGDSPPDFRHLETIIDIRQCVGGLPTDAALLRLIGERGREAIQRLGWDPLINLFNRHEHSDSLGTPFRGAV